MAMRKLKKYMATKFKAKDNKYDKAAADYAVNFIEKRQESDFSLRKKQI